MEFCENCKSIMKTKRESEKTTLVCSCGHEKEVERKVMKEKAEQSKDVEVVHDTRDPLAVYPHKCSKCGYGKAQLISKGIWYSDEDEVIEYKCGKCGYHEKDQDQKIT